MNNEKIDPEVLKILEKIQKRGISIQKLWAQNKKDLDRLKEIESIQPILLRGLGLHENR